jgi:hypothetical protein
VENKVKLVDLFMAQQEKDQHELDGLKLDALN